MNKRQRRAEARFIADKRKQDARDATDECVAAIVRTAAIRQRRAESKAAQAHTAGAGKRTQKAGTKRAGSASYRPESGPVIATGAYAVIKNDAWEALVALGIVS